MKNSTVTILRRSQILANIANDTSETFDVRKIAKKRLDNANAKIDNIISDYKSELNVTSKNIVKHKSKVSSSFEHNRNLPKYYCSNCLIVITSKVRRIAISKMISCGKIPFCKECNNTVQILSGFRKIETITHNIII